MFSNAIMYIKKPNIQMLQNSLISIIKFLVISLKKSQFLQNPFI
jgi:hypothetical protein